jgi:hypothetical protein
LVDVFGELVGVEVDDGSCSRSGEARWDFVILGGSGFLFVGGQNAMGNAAQTVVNAFWWDSNSAVDQPGSDKGKCPEREHNE